MEIALTILIFFTPLVGVIWLGWLSRSKSKKIKALEQRLQTVSRWRAHTYQESGQIPPPPDQLGPPTEADVARLSGDLEADIARVVAVRAELAELSRQAEWTRAQTASRAEASRAELDTLARQRGELQSALSAISGEVSTRRAELDTTVAELTARRAERDGILGELGLLGQVDPTRKALAAAEAKLAAAEKELERVRAEIARGSGTIISREFGFREPTYDCTDAAGYREELTELRRAQKKAAADKSAVTYTAYTVNGSAAEGEKMAARMIKLIVRAFNNECEALIHKVTYKNLESIESRIERAFTQLNDLNEINNVSLTQEYLALKKRELYLVYRYHQQKEDEREELRRQREAEREEKAREREVQERKKLVDKDITHHERMVATLREQLEQAAREADAEVARRVQAEMDALAATIETKRREKEELDHTLLSAKAGYVYIISNLGAFGEDIVKIGVTRRLEPLERIKELSSASVPFPFDVHALVFSEDAFGLEAELHRHFSAHRVNLVNHRKEFFRVSMDRVRAKLDEYRDLVVDFSAEAAADEYRESVALREAG